MSVSVSNEVLTKAVTESGQNWSQAARLLSEQGISIGRDTVRRRFLSLQTKNQLTLEEPLPDAELPLNRLLDIKDEQYQKKKEHYQKTRHVRVNVNLDGPIGLGWFGDPHLDDDGCDTKLAFKHADLFDGRNEGMYGSCVGDFRNLWIGSKLSSKWGDQMATKSQANQLLKHFLERICWFIMVGGNHDAWAGGDDLLEEWCQNACLLMRAHRILVTLVFPNGFEYTIYVAHDFKGKSRFTPAHGPNAKAISHRMARMYICGHLHDAGYMNGFHPNGQQYHSVRLGSYKYLDDYPEILDLEPVEGFVCPVSIIDPYATKEVNHVTWVWDPEEAADLLAWKRKRWKANKSSD